MNLKDCGENTEDDERTAEDSDTTVPFMNTGIGLLTTAAARLERR